MRNEVLKYKEKTGFIPEIGIVFCGNRAVITIRHGKESPTDHLNVFYAKPFFWLRFMFGCIETFRKVNLSTPVVIK